MFIYHIDVVDSFIIYKLTMHQSNSVSLHQEINPELTALFGPIPDSEQPEQQHAVTREKARVCLEILKIVAVDDAMQRWNLLEKI